MLASVAIFSYSLTAIAFLFLSLLLMTSWRGRLHGIALAVVCFITAIWAATVAYQATQGVPLSLLTDILEILRNAGWATFLLMLLGPFQHTKTITPFNLKTSVLAIAALFSLRLIATITAHLSTESLPLFLGLFNSAIARVGVAVIGMLLVEQLFRNTPQKDRWGIKFACLGIGGLFVYDFYLYTNAMMFRRIDAEIWAARGVVDALVVPLIAVSAARNPQWSLGISVSRRILFHSATLIGAATYLLAMAAAGYYLRFFGGQWGTVMQMAFLFGAVILLVSVLFSGAYRSWLKVFISKHFYNYNYDYREEWVRFTRTLSEHGPGLGERTIQAVANLVESPSGVLYISKESGNCEPVAHWNMPITSGAEPVSGAFCQFLEAKQWVVDLHEIDINPAKYDALTTPDWLRDLPKAWLVVPLILQGRLFGMVVLSQSRSKIKLNWEIIDLLKIAGSQAASYLAQQESTNALMVARQFESFNRMSTFMVHDLKNLVFQLSLLLSNAEKHKHNPAFQQDMLETVEHSVQKMKLLLQKLSGGSSIEKPTPLFIEKLLQQAVGMKATAEPKPVLEILDFGLTVFANWARLERVIGHIIQNAVEATAGDGQVLVRLTKEEGCAVVELKDSGHGMSEEFIRERLFKPFDTTKSAGMGIGVFESREYIQELGGQLEVDSRESIGTTFRLILPLYTDDEQMIEAA